MSAFHLQHFKRTFPLIRPLFNSRCLWSRNVGVIQSRTFSMNGKDDILSQIKIRSAQSKDVPTLCDMFNAEKWNYCNDTVETFVDIAGDTFLVADLNGKVVGSMVAGLISDSEAFGGFACVVPELRKRGIAKALWAKRAEMVGERNFGVKSVLHREEILKKHGYTVSTYATPLITGGIDVATLDVDNDADIQIMPTSDVDFQALVKYDAEIHTIPRPTFLKKWLAKPSVKTVSAIDKSGNVVGYVVIRQAEKAGSYRICPLYADTPLVTKLLLQRILAIIPKDAVVDMYMNPYSETGKDIVERNKATLSTAFSLVKMFTKRDVDLPQHHKVLAYSTVEIDFV